MIDNASCLFHKLPLSEYTPIIYFTIESIESYAPYWMNSYVVRIKSANISYSTLLPNIVFLAIRYIFLIQNTTEESPYSRFVCKVLICTNSARCHRLTDFISTCTVTLIPSFQFSHCCMCHCPMSDNLITLFIFTSTLRE